jgi:hypothetical protein
MDISQTVWNESDSLNNTPAPDGAPEGMAPSGVDDVIRADRGAIKRWYNQTIPLLTGGTATAFTLTYSVVPTALADGQTHLVRFHAANGAAATLNVNALGARPIYCYAGAWVAAPIGMLATDQVVRVAYNVAAGAYFLLDLPYSSAQSPSAVSTVDFLNIPAGINHLQCSFELTPSTDSVNIALQVYGSGGILDTGSTYFSNSLVWSSAGVISVAAGLLSSLGLSGNTIGNGSQGGLAGTFNAQNIQASDYTKFQFLTNCTTAGFGNAFGTSGTGWHQVGPASLASAFSFQPAHSPGASRCWAAPTKAIVNPDPRPGWRRSTRAPSCGVETWSTDKMAYVSVPCAGGQEPEQPKGQHCYGSS